MAGDETQYMIPEMHLPAGTAPPKKKTRKSKRRLKVAVFCWESLYAERVGGLAPVATALAEKIAGDCEVHFFTRGPSGDQDIHGVHYHYCVPSGPDIVAYCRDMSAKLFERFRDYDSPPFDLIHFHDWHFVDTLRELKNRNTVISFHSTEYGRNGGNFGDWWEFGEISGMEWFAAHIARQIITVSRTTRDEIVTLYHVPENRIRVIPNGIDPDRYRMLVDAGTVKREYGIDPAAPLILFVGRLVYQKGPDLLLDAVPLILRDNPDAQFIFTGDGSMRAHCEEKARGLPVRFTGYISDGDHLKLLNSADIVVIPSRNEPFGLVLTEAWSAERCVVASDVGGLSENIENFVDGIRVSVTPESFAWAVHYLLDDPASIRAFGAAGRRKVEKNFTWEKVIAMMLEVYAAVAAVETA